MATSPRELLDDAMSLMKSEIARMRGDVPLDKTDSKALAAYAGVAATVVRDQNKLDTDTLKELGLGKLEELAASAIAELQARGLDINGEGPAA